VDGGPEVWQFGLVALGFALSVEAKRHPALLVALGAVVGLVLAAQP
jgi:hypothetical protein